MSESTIIGWLLTGAEPTPTVFKLLRHAPSSFADPVCGRIARAIDHMRAEGIPVAALTVREKLPDDGVAIATIEQDGISADISEHHALELWETYRQRRIASVFDEAADAMRSSPGQVDSITTSARQAIDDLDSEHSARSWFRFYTPSECRNYTPPQGLVLVGDNHIVRGSVCVIAGAPGVGKSRSAVALAVAGATGADWFGLPVHSKFKTAIIQNENGRHRLRSEFADIAVDLDDYVRISEPPDYGMAFDQPEFRSQLSKWLVSFQPDVVVLDPWNSAARDDRHRDYKECLDHIKQCLPVGAKAPALIIVAHTRKPQGDAQKTGRSLLAEVSGSHILASVPRSVFVMQAASDDPEDDQVIWSCCKNNDGALGSRTAWRRRNGLFDPASDFNWASFDAPEKQGRPSTHDPEQLRALLPPEGLHFTEWKTRAVNAGVSESTLKRSIKSLEASRRIMKSASTHKYQPIEPAGTYPVEV